MDAPGFLRAVFIRSCGVLLLGLASWMLLSPPEAGPAYLEGPPPGHTGGFNEPTCQACHSGEPLNEASGDLALSGVPASYNPSDSYLLTITLRRGLLQRAGFQWTAPAERTSAIVFHTAANASNGDNSEFGDFVYNGSWRSVAWAP